MGMRGDDPTPFLDVRLASTDLQLLRRALLLHVAALPQSVIDDDHDESNTSNEEDDDDGRDGEEDGEATQLDLEGMFEAVRGTEQRFELSTALVRWLRLHNAATATACVLLLRQMEPPQDISMLLRGESLAAAVASRLLAMAAPLYRRIVLGPFVTRAVLLPSPPVAAEHLRRLLQRLRSSPALLPVEACVFLHRLHAEVEERLGSACALLALSNLVVLRYLIPAITAPHHPRHALLDSSSSVDSALPAPASPTSQQEEKSHSPGRSGGSSPLARKATRKRAGGSGWSSSLRHRRLRQNEGQHSADSLVKRPSSMSQPPPRRLASASCFSGVNRDDDHIANATTTPPSREALRLLTSAGKVLLCVTGGVPWRGEDEAEGQLAAVVDEALQDPDGNPLHTMLKGFVARGREPVVEDGREPYYALSKEQSSEDDENTEDEEDDNREDEEKDEATEEVAEDNRDTANKHRQQNQHQDSLGEAWLGERSAALEGEELSALNAIGIIIASAAPLLQKWKGGCEVQENQPDNTASRLRTALHLIGLP